MSRINEFTDDIAYYSILAEEHYKILDSLGSAQSIFSDRFIETPDGQMSSLLDALLVTHPSISAQGAIYSVGQFLE